MSAVEAAKREVSRLRRGKGEAIEAFAARRYTRQMEVCSSYAGQDFLSWDRQSQDVRDHWIETTRRHCEG